MLQSEIYRLDEDEDDDEFNDNLSDEEDNVEDDDIEEWEGVRGTCRLRFFFRFPFNVKQLKTQSRYTHNTIHVSKASLIRSDITRWIRN